jgi:hypothetical protein
MVFLSKLLIIILIFIFAPIHGTKTSETELLGLEIHIEDKEEPDSLINLNNEGVLGEIYQPLDSDWISPGTPNTEIPMDYKERRRIFQLSVARFMTLFGIIWILVFALGLSIAIKIGPRCKVYI